MTNNRAEIIRKIIQNLRKDKHKRLHIGIMHDNPDEIKQMYFSDLSNCIFYTDTKSMLKSQGGRAKMHILFVSFVHHNFTISPLTRLLAKITANCHMHGTIIFEVDFQADKTEFTHKDGWKLGANFTEFLLKQNLNVTVVFFSENEPLWLVCTKFRRLKHAKRRHV